MINHPFISKICKGLDNLTARLKKLEHEKREIANLIALLADEVEETQNKNDFLLRRIKMEAYYIEKLYNKLGFDMIEDK